MVGLKKNNNNGLRNILFSQLKDILGEFTPFLLDGSKGSGIMEYLEK